MPAAPLCLSPVRPVVLSRRPPPLSSPSAVRRGPPPQRSVVRSVATSAALRPLVSSCKDRSRRQLLVRRFLSPSFPSAQAPSAAASSSPPPPVLGVAGLCSLGVLCVGFYLDLDTH
ncbi:unnamed protein product [Citrullus colocynthis]|uniref:Uncharacterized protein n=1 Tax=Citrullus colocynthis TaxID=252529 RepID=A0ABP0Y9F5_9ROSI